MTASRSLPLFAYELFSAESNWSFGKQRNERRAEGFQSMGKTKDAVHGGTHPGQGACSPLSTALGLGVRSRTCYRKVDNDPRTITKPFLHFICEIAPALSIASRIQGTIVVLRSELGAETWPCLLRSENRQCSIGRWPCAYLFKTKPLVLLNYSR